MERGERRAFQSAGFGGMLTGLESSIGFDTFCPVSSFIEAKDVKDPHNLQLWYKVNGAMKQNGNTDLMIYKIEQLIAHCSSIMRLEEGDLILTGLFHLVSFRKCMRLTMCRRHS